MVCFDFVELKSFHQRDAIFNIRVCFDLFGPDENLEFITKKKSLDSTWSETRPLNALKYINKIRSESVQISFQFWKFSAREIWFPGKCDYFVWKQEMKSICGHAGRLYNVYNFFHSHFSHLIWSCEFRWRSGNRMSRWRCPERRDPNFFIITQ